VVVPAENQVRLEVPLGARSITPSSVMVDPDVELLARIVVHHP